MTQTSRYYVIDMNSPMPLYHQIKQNILGLIQANVLRTGDALPSERELSESYGVNRMTVRQAITELSNHGVVRRLHGVGTFVTDQNISTPLVPTVTGFSERYRSAGMRPASIVIGLEKIQANPVIAERLHIESKALVIALKRLRLVNDKPLMLETSYLSFAQFPALVNEDFSSQSLYDVLERRYGTHIRETEHTLEPTLLTDTESDYFQMAPGQPAMLVHITAYTDQHQPVEFCKSIIRGDRCRYYFTVNTQSPIIDR
jgi:GntR family transcriptional regulator